MEKLVVTGCSGFIGTNVMLAMKDKYEVLGLDKVPPRSFILNWQQVDLLNYDELNRVINSFSPDYIIHLAARTDLGGATLNDYNANIEGVENIVKVAEGLPNLKKILVTSSMLVCRTGYYPKNQFDYLPTTFYGKSKVKTEKIMWDSKLRCDWAILRPTSIWGPWFGVPYRNFFDMVMAHTYFHIGHKGCTKTYGYIGNVVYQIENILSNDTTDRNNKVFYLGDYEPYNIEEWANEIAEQLGSKIIRMPFSLIKLAAWFGDALKLVHIGFPMTSFRLKNMTTDNIINLSNTKRIAPNLPFTRKEGIKETLRWMKG